MKETSHTPGPWNLDAPFPEMANRIVDADGFDIVDMGPGPSPLANAAFIVRACNAYDDMLAALERVGKYFEQKGTAETQGVACDVWAAIRKATGQGPNGTE
jgi:hypothetical protein